MIPIAVLAAVASGCGSSGGGSFIDERCPDISAQPGLIHGTILGGIDPADFVATIDNRYFPLKPGTARHYKGLAGEREDPADRR